MTNQLNFLLTFISGLGIPVYSYLALSDGEMIAEVSLSMVGVIGRSAGKTKPEVRFHFSIHQPINNQLIFLTVILLGS